MVPQDQDTCAGATRSEEQMIKPDWASGANRCPKLLERQCRGRVSIQFIAPEGFRNTIVVIRSNRALAIRVENSLGTSNLDTPMTW